MLALHILASGSKGNAAIVEDVSSGHGLLIDCGICKRDTFGRAEEAGFDIANLDAILITHDHSDHTKCIGVVTRGLPHKAIDLFALGDVARASRHISDLVDGINLREMEPELRLRIGGITVMPFETYHDAAASCGFRFEASDGDAIGFVTDTGTVSDKMLASLSDVRILAIESNHDARMLRDGDYPAILKDRVASDAGHLSNDQAASALEQLIHPGLEQVIAMHISENNNLVSHALESLQAVVEKSGLQVTVRAASQRMLVSAR